MNRKMRWVDDAGVYFIECDGFIKIGYAGIANARWDAIRVCNPHTSTPLGLIHERDDVAAKALEASIHAELAAFRHKGEWFIDCPEVRRLIAARASAWPMRWPRRKSQPVAQ